METVRTEISRELLEAVRQLVRAQGRSEREIMDEAVRDYLASLRRGRHEEDFPALLDRMSSRFDLDEDEALELANEELHALRRERRQTGH